MKNTDFPHDADAIEDIPLPREQNALSGHQSAARSLHDAYRSGRMHHAHLITGPRGIGKATLAFAFARFALSHPDPLAAPPVGDRPLQPFDANVAAKIAAGAHPNLLHLRRPWDEKEKKFKTVLTIDEIRRALPFFGQASGTAGPRIALVDAADEMSTEAANALLKMLEEPPPRALFLVLSHAPGKLLPTIRSRCQRLSLSPLAQNEILDILRTFGQAPEAEEQPALLALSEGSVRRALTLLDGDGPKLFAAFQSVVERFPTLDRRALHALGDLAGGGRRGEGGLYLLASLARRWLSAQLHETPHAPASKLVIYADALEKIEILLAETDALNLDRKQTAIAIIESLAESAQKPLNKASM